MKKVLLLLLLAFPMTPIYADLYHGVGRDLNLTVYQFDNEKLFIIKYELNCGLSYVVFIMLSYVPPISTFWRIFLNHK